MSEITTANALVIQASPTNGRTILTGQVPYSQEAEEAVIGAVMVNPSAFLVVASFLHADDFYILRHNYIWEAFDRLSQQGTPIDYLTVQEELKAVGRLVEIGGPAYLTHLINSTPTSVHAEIYGQLVSKAAMRRRYLSAGDEIKSLAMDEEISVDTMEAESHARLLQIGRSSSRSFTSMQSAVIAHSERTQEAFENPRDLLGIPSAISALNTVTKGYRGSKLYILAGRPGMGKTSMLLTEAAYMGGVKRLPVAVFSLEMGEEEVTDCLISGVAEIEADKLAAGDFNQQEYQKYLHVSGQMIRWPIYIDDSTDLTPSLLRLRCLRLYHEVGLAAVFVDYIQLMSGGREQRYDNRDQEIGYISRSLKHLAKELNIPVLAAAQLSRSVEQRADKHPQLSDLRESGNIENDADCVMLLYRDDYYAKPVPQPVVSKVDIGIAKHRGGKTGNVEAGFYGAYKKMVGYTT